MLVKVHDPLLTRTDCFVGNAYSWYESFGTLNTLKQKSITVPLGFSSIPTLILITEYFFTGGGDNEAGLAVQNDGTVFCTVCCKTLANIQNGKLHFAEVHQPHLEISATCKICHRTFKNKRSRNNHYNVVHHVSAAAMKNLIVPNQGK